MDDEIKGCRRISWRRNGYDAASIVATVNEPICFAVISGYRPDITPQLIGGVCDQGMHKSYRDHNESDIARHSR
jgi:hypothetical protein